MNHVAQRVAGSVRAEMARRRVSQAALAQHLSISQAAVSRRLLGVVPFDVIELEAAAELLGIPTDRLLAKTDEPAVSA